MEKTLELFEKYINNTNKKEIIDLFDKVDRKNIEGVSLEEYFDSFDDQLNTICLPSEECQFELDEISVDVNCHWYSSENKVEENPIVIKETNEGEFTFVVNEKLLYNPNSKGFQLAA